MNTLSNNPYVATVGTENERSFFLSDSEWKKVDSTLRRLWFDPSEEFITDIRLDDANNSLKQIGVKPRIRISRIGDRTEIQLTLKIRSTESWSVFQNVFDKIHQQKSRVILSENKQKLIKSYTKDGKYEEGEEITIMLPQEVVDMTDEKTMVDSICNNIQKNVDNIVQAFQEVLKESHGTSSSISLGGQMFASLGVINIRSRKRLNYEQSIDGIYPDIVVALEPGRSQMKLDIEWPNDVIIRNFAAKIGVMPHISDSVVEELTKNVESNTMEILQKIFPYAQSQIIRRMVRFNILHLNDEWYSGIAWKFLAQESNDPKMDESVKKKDNFRKFDRLYPFYQEEIQKYILKKSQWSHTDIHESQKNLWDKLYAIFIIFGEKINPTLFPILLDLPEKILNKYKVRILSWHTKYGDSPFFKILRNGMRQAIRQDISVNHSAISDETTHRVYREHMIAMFRELYRLFEVYHDSERGLPWAIFEKIKEYISIFQKLMFEWITLWDKNGDQFLNFIQQYSKSLSWVDYLVYYFQEAMIRTYHGDTSDQMKLFIDQGLRNRRDLDQEQWKWNDIITRHSELFDKIDVMNITFNEWIRMTHRARISFFMNKIITIDKEKQTLRLSDEFVDKVKKAHTSGLFKGIAQPLYKQFYNNIYDSLEDYVHSLQSQYDGLCDRLAKTTDIVDFVRDNMNDVYLLLAVFEQTFKDRKDQEAQKKYSNVSYGVMQTLGDRMQRGDIFSKIDESKKDLYFAIRPKNRAWLSLEDALGRYDHQMQHYHIDLTSEDFQFNLLWENRYMKDISELYIFSSSASENRAFLKYVAIDIVTRLLGWEHIEMIHPYADEREYPDLQALKWYNGGFSKMHEKYENFKNVLFRYGFVAKDGSIKKNEAFHLRRFLKFAYSQVKIVDKMLSQSRTEDRVILEDLLDPKKVANKDLKQMLLHSKVDIPSDTKDFERTFIKSISKYAWVHEWLGDLVRGRIILDTTDRSIDMISYLIEHVRHHDKIHAFVIEDNTGNLMEKPKKSTGYRDITFSLQLNGWNIIEIQLVAQPIVEAKQNGYPLHYAIGYNDSLIQRFKKSICTHFTEQDRDDIQRIIYGINTHKKGNDDMMVLPREFNELFWVDISIESQYIASQDDMSLSSDMLYKIHRNLPDDSELAQKLKKIESILYDIAMGKLVAEEIRDMLQKDKNRNKKEKVTKKQPWLSSSIRQIVDSLPFKGR